MTVWTWLVRICVCEFAGVLTNVELIRNLCHLSNVTLWQIILFIFLFFFCFFFFCFHTTITSEATFRGNFSESCSFSTFFHHLYTSCSLRPDTSLKQFFFCCENTNLLEEAPSLRCIHEQQFQIKSGPNSLHSLWKFSGVQLWKTAFIKFKVGFSAGESAHFIWNQSLDSGAFTVSRPRQMEVINYKYIDFSKWSL